MRKQLTELLRRQAQFFEVAFDRIATTAQEPARLLGVVAMVGMSVLTGTEFAAANSALVVLELAQRFDHFMGEAGAMQSALGASLWKVGGIGCFLEFVMLPNLCLLLFALCISTASSNVLRFCIERSSLLLCLWSAGVLTTLCANSFPCFRVLSIFANMRQMCRPLLRSAIRLSFIRCHLETSNSCDYTQLYSGFIKYMRNPK